MVSPVYMRGFEGLLRGQLLVVAGGCEGIMPDITRCACGGLACKLLAGAAVAWQVMQWA